MKEPVPSDFPVNQPPRNIHESISEVNDQLRTCVVGDPDLIYDIYDRLQTLDEASGLVDKDLIFSGKGIVVSFKDGEPLDAQPFNLDQAVGTSLGFDVWTHDDNDPGRVYLSVRTTALSYNDDGEIENGSIYFLDPFDSAITMVEASFDDIVSDLDDMSDAYDNGVAFEKVIKLIGRYERMVKSMKFKKLDEAAKSQMVEKSLARLNKRIEALGLAVNISGDKVYLRDFREGGFVPRIADSAIVRGEPAAFVSLYSVMPEMRADLPHDQLCLALAPDEDTALNLNATEAQIVFTPITKESDIIVEPVFNHYS